MLYCEYDPEVERRVVREEALEEGREYFLELLNKDLTKEEIKAQLQRENTFRR